MLSRIARQQYAMIHFLTIRPPLKLTLSAFGQR
jgi:hypothetical protein